MANEKRLISRYQLEQARYRGNNVYGYFNAYCHLNSSCDGCNRWVRLLCKLRSKIEVLQTEIILSVCKGGGIIMANEKRLIDANALRKVFINEECNCEMFPWAVDNAPTVDAVEVVRCKECENRVYVDNGDEIGEIGGCKLFKMAMPYDSFCSYGKRRSTENA